jgi:hypothetical protein
MNAHAGAIEAIAAAASPAGGMELLGGDALPRPGPEPGRDPWLVVRRFLAAGAVLRRPDAFHAAVAVGPLQVDIARLEASAAPRCTIAAQSRVRPMSPTSPKDLAANMGPMPTSSTSVVLDCVTAAWRRCWTVVMR